MPPASNPLVSDALVAFLLYDVLDAPALCDFPDFAEHGRETFDPWVAACRRLARESLFPAYRAMDEEPPRLERGQIRVHPQMHRLWDQLLELGVIASTRPPDVGGQGLPLTVSALATSYLMAANASACGYAGLTTGAAHLIERFGDPALRAAYLPHLYSGRWAGTMALTEPQAGSSLADVTTSAQPTAEGHWLIRGAKIFISGGDQDLTENIVHLVLARTPGAPAGTKGISLFAVPKKRPAASGLEANDVQVSGVIHKIGWRGLPSLALAFGEENDCRGWRVGPEHQGLRCMFQMMNEARIMVGVNAAATASVAFHESLAYAKDRRQGRPVGANDATAPPVALVQHADVRRMLLRQKAIVEGALCLLGVTARYADVSEHAPDEADRARAKALLDLLTPIAKSFPSERGFESNTLALQIHGGYGYSSEYLPESWLRDQKLNSIHEGTTTIQGLDLLGRKVVAGGGAALAALGEEIHSDLAAASTAGVDAKDVEQVKGAFERWVGLTSALAQRGLGGDLEGMLGHSSDFLELASIVVIGWMWIKMTARLGRRDDAFAKGLRHAGRYWIRTEVPRVAAMATLCEEPERSFLDVSPDWL